MSLLSDTLARIVPADASAGAAVQQRLDRKTKPRGSLGRLEELAVRLATMRGIALPRATVKAVVVMAADHGVAAEGVSAYPQEVTRQMVLNFARGGAAINVLARHVGARVVVVDMGCKEPVDAGAGVRVHRIGAGTESFTKGPAMTRAQAEAAIEIGIALARELHADGVDVLALGEMGIGNTTSASALTAVLTGVTPKEVTGRGTGIDDAGYQRKVAAIKRAIEVNRPDPKDALDVLAKLGGFEIAGLAGVALGAAAERMAVVMDGLISSAAALVAARLDERVAGYLLPSHVSVEVAHRLVLGALGMKPLLSMEMRLGEGTGAVLAMPLLDAALLIVHDMATFDAAGVTDAGA